MKNLRIILILLLHLGLIYSCIYESSVPIDDPSIAIDENLLYTWENQENGDRYTLSRYDQYTYDVLEFSKANNTLTKMRAFASDIDGTTFLNVMNYGKNAREVKFRILKIVIDNNFDFHLIPLTSNITEQFKTSSELKRFIKSNMSNSFFYEKSTLFRRTDIKYHPFISPNEHLVFISDCRPNAINETKPARHKDKDVVIYRNFLPHQTYITEMYRLENGIICAHRFENSTKTNYDIGAYQWLNDSSISFKIINSELKISETYTISGFQGKTQIVTGN